MISLLLNYCPIRGLCCVYGACSRHPAREKLEPFICVVQQKAEMVSHDANLSGLVFRVADHIKQ